MRLTIYISIILVATFLLGFRLFTNPVHITGHLKRNPKDTSAYVEGIAVIVKGDNKILAHTFADTQGNFEITFTPEKEKTFDFFVFGVAVDTMLISSVQAFDSDTTEMTFYIPALRKKNFLVQVLARNAARQIKFIKLNMVTELFLSNKSVKRVTQLTAQFIKESIKQALALLVLQNIFVT